jgi:ABC-type glycerol-3-phosphate transport system substrate-binding protein
MELTRRAALAALGASGLATVASCGRPTVKPVRAGQVTVNVATNDPNYPNYFTTWTKKLSAQRGPYRYALKSFIESTDQVITKLIAAYMSHSAMPELPGLEISQFSRLQRGNIAKYMLLDLGARIPNLHRDFYSARLTPYTSSGSVYGMESDMCLAVYFYREDLFAKYKIPTTFETWDDLIKLGAEVNRKHGVSLGAIGDNDISWVAMMTLQQGGQFFSTDGQLRLDSPEAIRALETFIKGVQAGAFAHFTNFYGAAAASSLNADKVIGYFMPDWFEPFVLRLNAPTQKGKWRMRVLPRFNKGGPTSVWGGTGFGVTKNQRNTEAALTLLEAAYGTVEGQVQRFLQAHYLPTMKAAWNDPRLLRYEDDYLGGQRPFEVYRSIVDKAPTMITNEYWDVMNSELAIAISDALLGKKSARAAIASAASSIRSQMT